MPVCLLRTGQLRRAGDAAKLGQFIGQFSWVTDDPKGVKGLTIQNICTCQDKFNRTICTLKKRHHGTQVHIALRIFSGILIANRTTKEYEKCYMDPCTVAPLFRGADGPNSFISFLTTSNQLGLAPSTCFSSEHSCLYAHLIPRHYFSSLSKRYHTST